MLAMWMFFWDWGGGAPPVTPAADGVGGSKDILQLQKMDFPKL